MGCDIHSFAEVKRNGKWEEITDAIFPDYGDKKTSEPFAWRSYGMFAFLAGVRNLSGVTPISEPKGLPDDSEYLNAVHRYADTTNMMNGEEIPIEERETNKQHYENDYDYHSMSYLTAKELLDFNYDQTFEDRRTSKVFKDRGGRTVMAGAIFDDQVKEGEGEIRTYREFLGTGYFADLEILKSLDEPKNVRIVFWFDN